MRLSPTNFRRVVVGFSVGVSPVRNINGHWRVVPKVIFEIKGAQ